MKTAASQPRPWQLWVRPLWLRPTLAVPVWGVLAVLLTLLAGAVFAYSRPLSLSIAVGQSVSWPFVHGFHAAEGDAALGTRWRWTGSRAAIGAPYAGDVTRLTVRFNGEEGGPPVALSAAGGATVTLMPRVGWQTVALPVADDGRSWHKLARPLLVIETQAAPRGDDPRALGVAVAGATLEVQPSAPPFGLLLALSTSLLLLSSLLRALRAPFPWAVGVVLALVATWLLAHPWWRLYLTVYAWRLVGLLVIAWVLYAGARILLPRLWLAARVQIAPRATTQLIGLMLLIFALRYSALSYPLTFASDLPWHIDRANLAAGGHIMRLFLPDASRAPVQWEVAVAVPYSPFYYYVTGLLVWLLPFPTSLILNAFSSLVEAATVPLLALLALRGGLGQRAALWGAAFYGVVPFGYLAAVGWALFPTLLGQWLALAALALLVCWWPGKPSPNQMRWQVALLTLAFVAYLTALTFLATTWAALLLISLVWYRQAVRPLLMSGIAAGLLALLLYYGWQLPALLAQALPALQASGDASGGVGIARGSIGPLAFAEFLWERFEKWYPWRLLVPAALGVALLLFLRRRRQLLLVLVAWCSIYVPFMLLDRFLPLLDKPQLHLLPALALLAGIGAAMLTRRGRVAYVVPLSLVLLLGWEMLNMAVYIVTQMAGKLKF